MSGVETSGPTVAGSGRFREKTVEQQKTVSEVFRGWILALVTHSEGPVELVGAERAVGMGGGDEDLGVELDLLQSDTVVEHHGSTCVCVGGGPHGHSPPEDDGAARESRGTDEGPYQRGTVPPG